MAQKNIQVNLMFQANTAAAVQNIQQLGTLLHNIGTNTRIGVDSGPLQQASQAAQQLQVHLQNALNVNTGKLDLTKLSTSLKQAGTDLMSLSTKLQAAGPTGQQAFLKIATAVAQAEAPIVRLNGRLKAFGTTLVNTIKWQVASSAIQAVTGSISKAISHAEELNTALNRIQIVTGYSTQYMAGFAKEAKKAANELSTTSTKFAEASLIFYQQGLSGDAVLERAETVIKLANVTGQSAQIVSDQMTAIWNNFYDGTESLEYYADVITKLGAATASSSDEIADGLEKFAAIADTVGLSYEYAAAALATVTAETRQSADVVGTAFKTIFARMEGLKLGETLDDGTTLNKYSEALATVGVNIKDQSGELRNMDKILDDLGAKWELLGKDQQVALAQSVAGVRQYSQFIAMMDNWDKIEMNIDLTYDSEGTLEEQQDIWADSWEAAHQRVKQAQNELYENFIDDSSIVNLTNMFADIIKGVTNVIDSMGGIGPLVLMLVGLFSKTLFPMVINGFQRLGNVISIWSGKAQNDVNKLQQEFSESLNQMASNTNLSDNLRIQTVLTNQLLQAKQKLALTSKNLSIAEREEAERRVATLEALINETQKSVAKKAALEEEIKAIKEKLALEAKGSFAQNVGVANYAAQSGASDEEIEQLQKNSLMKNSIGKNKKLLKQQDLVSQESEVQQQYDNATSSVLSLSDSGNINTVAGQEAIKLQEQLRKKLDKIAEAKKELGKYNDEEIADLKKVVDLQEQINKAQKNPAKASEVKKDRDFGSPEATGVSTSSYEAKMFSQVQKEMDGSVNEATGMLQTDASLASLEKAYQLLSQYKDQVSQLTALETELNNAQMADNRPEAIQTEIAGKEAHIEALRKEAEATNISKERKQEITKEIAKEQAAIKKLSKEHADLVKARDKEQKGLKSGQKAQTNYTKTLTAAKNKILDMAKSSGLSETQIQNLSKAFKDVEKNGPAATDSIKFIEKAMKNLTSGSLATKDGIENMANSIQNELIEMGMSAEQINKFVDYLLKLGVISPDIANKIRQVGNAADELGNKGVSASTKFMNGLTSLATAAGAMSMAISSIQNMANAFNEGNTPLETFSALLMGISMILPMIVKGTQSLAEATFLQAAATGLSNAQEATKLKLETATGAKKIWLTALTWLQTAAEVALKIAQNPVLGAVILGLIVASTVAVMALTKGTKEATEAKKADNEATMEGAQKTVELADKWKEQMKTMDDLIAKYKELAKAGKDTVEAEQEIIDQIPEMLGAYRDIRNSLNLTGDERKKYNQLIEELETAEATGDIEKAEKITNELDTMVANKTATKTAAAAKAGMNNVASAIVEAGITGDGTSTFDDSGNVKLEVEGTGEEDVQAVNILRRDLPKEMIISMPDSGESGTVGIKLRTSSPAQFMSDYEALKQAGENIAAELPSDSLSDSGIYENVQEALEASKEQYEKFSEAQGNAAKYAGTNALLNTTSATAGQQRRGIKGKTADEIENYSEYESLKSNMITKLESEGMSADEAKEEAEKALSENNNTNKFLDLDKKLQAVEASFDNESTSTNEGAAIVSDIKSAYNELSDEEKTLFMNVDLNKYNTKEAIKGRIEELKKEEAFGEAISVGAELDYDEKTVKAYINNLQDVNDSLKENPKLASKVASANMKMTKGLGDLSEGWEENYDILKNGEKTSLEYAEAMGSVQTALETAFGYTPSTEFIEENLELIGKIANGSTEALDDLYEAMGKDYVANFDYRTITEGGKAVGLTADEMKSTLENVLQEISTQSIEMGEGITISDSYLENLQTMLDNGQMTKEELDNLFASQGITYDCELKEVDGATSVVESVTKKWDPATGDWTEGEKTRVESTEKMQVPILTGNAGNGTTSTIKPTFTRSGGTGLVKSATKKSGSSGGGSKKETKEKKKTSDETERYHEISKSIDKLSRGYDKLENKKAKASGKDLIKIMEEEEKLMENDLELQKKYAREIDKYLAKDASALKAYGANIENGLVTNYDELVEQQVAKYNAAVDKYNNSSQSDADKEAFEKAEEDYEKFKEILEQYEETYELSLDQQQTIADKELEIWEKNNEILLEAMEQRVEAFEKATDALGRQIDYLEKKIEDLEDEEYSAAKTAQLLGNEMAAAFGKAAKAQEEYEKAKADWGQAEKDFKAGNISKELLDQAWDNLVSAEEAVQDSTNTIKDIQEQIDGLLLNHLEDQAEAFDRVSQELEHYNGVLENYKNILDLLGRHYQDDDLMKKIADSQVQNAKAQIELAKNEYDLLVAELAAAKAAGANQETIDELTAQVQEAENTLLEAWQAGLEAVVAQFEQNLEIAIKNAEEALLKSDLFSLEQAKDAYDQKKSLNELYLEEYDKLYKINKLSRDINKSMSDLDSLGANMKLSEILDEINSKRASGVKMSQYEVDNLEKKYKLRLAEIALEEAQNAKGTMRLQRNASGNWSYVYTSDQEKIDQAQQQYEDALYELENASRDYLDEMQEMILQNQQDMMARIRELRVSDFATVEEYWNAIEEIYDQHAQKNEFYYNQLGIALNDINTAYDRQIITFRDLAISEVTGITSIYDGISTFHGSATTLLNEAKEAFMSYQGGVDLVTSASGADLRTLTSDVNTYVDTTNEKTTALSGSLKTLQSDASTGFQGVLRAIQDIQTQYRTEADSIISKNDEIAQSFLEIYAKQAGVNNYLKGYDENVDYSAEMVKYINNGGQAYDAAFQDLIIQRNNKSQNPTYAKWKDNVGGLTQAEAMAAFAIADTSGDARTWMDAFGNGSVTKTQIQNIKAALKAYDTDYDYTEMMTSYLRGGGKTSDDLYQAIWKNFEKKLSSEYANGVSYKDKYYKDQTLDEIWTQFAILGSGDSFMVKRPTAMATGGYTGDWGPSGKLAILHEKELVLNQGDTENFLSSLELMAHIVDIIDRNAMLAAAGRQIGGASAAAITEKIIQQTVSIEASFPGVTTAIEIEEALNNIVNDAAQYASVYKN